jgi:mevalonate kinase
VKAAAPGKIILFGEHAVVYGRAALAVPVTQVQAQAEVTPSPRPGIWIEAPDIQLSAELRSLPAGHPLAALLHNLLSGLCVIPYPNLTIRISSSIPVASGLGSGAAVSVALIRALSATLEHPLTDEEVSTYAYGIEKLHHGTPSGIDNTVITYARPVYFLKGRPIEMLRVREPFTIVIAHTGIAAPTRESVADVRRLWERDAPGSEVVFDGIQALSHMAREAIEAGMWRHLGPLMDENHALLQHLTVSSPELDRLVLAARRAGALGAKLSGGGRGGNMIALAPGSGPQAVADALTGAGSPRVIITTVEST